MNSSINLAQFVPQGEITSRAQQKATRAVQTANENLSRSEPWQIYQAAVAEEAIQGTILRQQLMHSEAAKPWRAAGAKAQAERASLGRVSDGTEKALRAAEHQLHTKTPEGIAYRRAQNQLRQGVESALAVVEQTAGYRQLAATLHGHGNVLASIQPETKSPNARRAVNGTHGMRRTDAEAVSTRAAEVVLEQRLAG